MFDFRGGYFSTPFGYLWAHIVQQSWLICFKIRTLPDFNKVSYSKKGKEKPSASILVFAIQEMYYLHLINPNKFEIKETTDTPYSDSYIDIDFYIDYTGRLKSKIYDKRDTFDFPVEVVMTQ